ncbi:CotH kinase family protein, partial [bacterium]|nr:CotH kinase family protein [bacterium]
MKSRSLFVALLLLSLSSHLLNATPPQVAEVNPMATQAAFYQTDAVQAVHLTIAEADQRRMMDALPDCVYVPASFRWRDLKLDNVAVRFKGNSSSQPNQKHKRSYLIRFDKYERDQRFLGLRRVSFDNGVQ